MCTQDTGDDNDMRTFFPARIVPSLQWTLADVELATVELFAQITASPPLHTGPDKRDALLKMLRWWSASHPSGRCKAGAQKLVSG